MIVFLFLACECVTQNKAKGKHGTGDYEPRASLCLIRSGMLTKGNPFAVLMFNTLIKSRQVSTADNRPMEQTVQKGFWSILWKENKVRGVILQPKSCPTPDPSPKGRRQQRGVHTNVH